MKKTFFVLTAAIALGALVGQSSGQGYAQPGYMPPGMYPQAAYGGYAPPQMYYAQQAAFAQQAAYAQQGPMGPIAPMASDPGTAAPCTSCGEGTACDPCAMGACNAQWEFFGEFLYLCARDAEVAYAVPINGPAVAPPSYPIQVGRVAAVNPDYEPGFRVGFARATDECSSLRGMYTYYESQTSDRIVIPGQQNRILRSLVTHPGTWTAASDGLDGQAFLDIDYQIADADYRHIFSCGPCHKLAYFGGASYVHLEQEFGAQFAVLGTERVASDIKFDGGGLRFGLEGERRAKNCGLLVYGRAAATFAAGEFRADYLQRDGQRGVVVDTNWTAGRVISILDMELGLGWAGPGDGLRFTVGYTINSWLNVVKTDEWIQAVQNNNFVGLGDTMTFDGFVARAELRF
jgi:hypothetical protein